MLHSVVYAIFALYAANRIRKLLLSYLLDRRIPVRISATFAPVSLAGGTLPSKWWNPGLKMTWTERLSFYKNAPLRTVVVTPILQGPTHVFSANIATFRQMFGSNSDFDKPSFAYQNFQFLGVNVFASIGETWKRHRRVTSPAFNEETYRNVWDTTAELYNSILENEKWLARETVDEPDINKLTHKLALFVVANVGFRIPLTWNAPERDESGQLSIPYMCLRVSENILARSRLPRWAYWLGSAKLAQIDEAYTLFERFLFERIAAREAELRKAREAGQDISGELRDILSRLVNAKLAERKNELSNQEIIGNCLVFVFAGHETTANTLTVTLALLGLYPEAQDWVYNAIKDVLGDREPSYSDFDSLEPVLACFFEALRLFPVVFITVRRAVRDTTLRLPRTDDPSVVENVPIKRGTEIISDSIGMCYDPQSFPDPETYNPRRWMTSGESRGSLSPTSFDSFVGFSYGPRVCIGQKFAKVEAVAFLTLLLRDWRVEAILKDGENAAMWRARVLDPKIVASLTNKDVPLRFVKRT